MACYLLLLPLILRATPDNAREKLKIKIEPINFKGKSVKSLTFLTLTDAKFRKKKKLNQGIKRRNVTTKKSG